MVTLEEIARRAGVSKWTVSRVLKGQHKENRPSMIKRAAEIRRLAAELGYRPNNAALTVKTGVHNALALIQNIHHGQTAFHRQLMSGMLQELGSRDMHLVYTDCPSDDAIAEGDMPKSLRQILADGLLLNYHESPPPALEEMIRRCDTPAVWINSDRDRDATRPEEFEAGARLAAYLLNLGHQRIAYMDMAYLASRVPHHYSRIERCEGVMKTVDEAGFRAELLAPERGLPPAQRVELIRQRLSGPDGPTAIVAAADADYAMIAAGLMDLDIPKDLSLVQIGDAPEPGQRVITTTMGVPWSRIGAESVKLVLRKIEDGCKSVKSTPIHLDLFEGRTTAQAPG